MNCVYYFPKCREVPLIINLGGIPTRRLVGDVATAVSVGELST